jgi:hypothetical protein
MLKVLIALLLITTNVTAKAELVVILKKSQPAPYAGVLMPDQDFKNLVIAEKQASELDIMLREKNSEYADLERQSETKQNWFFAVGVLLGGFIGWKVAK